MISKGMANSWGTLGVATEVTFKVLPAPETVTTLAVRGLTDEQAARVMALAMGSREEVSSAAHLPPTVANCFLDGKLGWEATTLLRLEGFAPSVEVRSRQLQALLGGSVDMLDEAQSRQIWREVRDVLPYAKTGDGRAVWRVSMTPMQGWRMVDEFRRHAGVDAYYDWQGGLIWMRMEAEPEAQVLRNLIAKYGGGHATLVRAPDALRTHVDVFEPQAPALAALASIETAIRPGEYPQSGTHLSISGWSLNRCKPISALNSYAIRVSAKPKNPAQMRPLRFLHRHLPDLCDAGQ